MSDLKLALVKAILAKKQAEASYTDLDTYYASLVPAEKTQVILSIFNGDEKTRQILRDKFKETFTAVASAEADGYILSGLMPVNLALYLNREA